VTDSPISFARGAPSADIMPADAIREAAQRVLTDDWERALAYGTGVGHPGLREWIAERHGVEVDQVLVTNGSMQADVFLFQHALEPGDAAVVESPSYDRTLLMLRELGADLFAVPLESDGIDVGALERALDSELRPKLAHIIPNFHNPAGCTLSEPKRRRLLELAGQHDILVFEDDPYVELRFEGSPLPTMFSLDTNDSVVYASSFSKTVSPGVRVGYLLGPGEVITRIATKATNTYISPNMLAEAIVWEFCRSGAIDDSIETVKNALRERRDALCEALNEQIPEAEFVIPEGGYFLWATLPEEVDTDALFEAAAEERVIFVKGSDFVLEGGRNNLRLAYSGVGVDQIREGVGRLARALERLRAGAPA
jgi:DNA-binding transcriptional MocR family regulator